LIEPVNGATVVSPVEVRFGVVGYEVRPAGDLTPGTGHHHLIIDSEPIRAAEPIPFDNNNHYIHYGQGQVEAMVNLPAGAHSLTAQFANGQHIACGITETIRVTVVSTPIG
jgi:hypothetical protein